MILNGNIPSAALVKIDATHYASPGCAQAWRGFAGELGLTVGNAADAAYRSLEWQRYRYHLHQQNPNLYPVAAYPGTSNHGWGQAIDIGNYYRYAHKTLVKVGRKYGFEFDTPSEAWHIRYLGAPLYAAANPAPKPTIIRRDPDMPVVLRNTVNSHDKNPGKYPGAIFIVDRTAISQKVGNDAARERSYLPTCDVVGDVQLVNQVKTFGWSQSDIDLLRKDGFNDSFIARNGGNKTGVIRP